MTKPCLKLVTPATVNRTVTPRRLPNRDQAKARRVGIYRRQVNWVLDADIQGFFDEECVRDTGVRLVAKWLRAGIVARSQKKNDAGPIRLSASFQVATVRSLGDKPRHELNAAPRCGLASFGRPPCACITAAFHKAINDRATASKDQRQRKVVKGCYRSQAPDR
jgi:hypothetical protein